MFFIVSIDASFITLLLLLKIYKMPRNYELKTVKRYTDKTLAKRINAIEDGKMSLCKASKYFHVLLHFSCILQIVSAISQSGRAASQQPAFIFHSLVNLLMYCFY